MSTVRAGKTEPLQEFEAILNIQRLLDDGASIINTLPFIDSLPGPKPWKIRAEEFRKREDAAYKKLIDQAMAAKASGINTWAAKFTGDTSEGEQRFLVKGFTTAAIETTAVTLQNFVLACIRYPEWIPTAQREIDLVVGNDRLPSFRDRPFLPYVEAIIRETHRWRPTARFGVPHQSVADDVIEYRGHEYFIPKGSNIFAVTWAIEHDQSRYKEPDRFIPERFLAPKGNLKSDYETSAFGFGRRG
ncbi:hypothetical protein C0993_009907 [Termitomyces sp. T159_Od127]|nr:hypothetical protein C0993_009907 [Termitomyces sp. T159_Od127]